MKKKYAAVLCMTVLMLVFAGGCGSKESVSVETGTEDTSVETGTETITAAEDTEGDGAVAEEEEPEIDPSRVLSFDDNMIQSLLTIPDMYRAYLAVEPFEEGGGWVAEDRISDRGKEDDMLDPDTIVLKKAILLGTPADWGNYNSASDYKKVYVYMEGTSFGGTEGYWFWDCNSHFLRDLEGGAIDCAETYSDANGMGGARIVSLGDGDTIEEQMAAHIEGCEAKNGHFRYNTLLDEIDF